MLLVSEEEGCANTDMTGPDEALFEGGGRVCVCVCVCVSSNPYVGASEAADQTGRRYLCMYTTDAALLIQTLEVEGQGVVPKEQRVT